MAGPAGINWSSPLRDVASGGHNVGDNVDGFRWNGVNWEGGGNNNGGGQVADPIETAKKLQQMQIDANQPAIATYQGQVDPLKQRYTDLIASIKGGFDVASNKQTLATGNELGRRGISNDSGVAQQAQADAQLPISTAYAGQQAGVGLAENSDLNQIANAIASLQAGNVQGAITGAGNIYSTQQNAANVATNALAQIQAAQIANQYHPISPGGSLYNANNNQLIGTPLASLTGLLNNGQVSSGQSNNNNNPYGIYSSIFGKG